jgi:glutamate-ammonia-ligase adenylyltransferase
MRRKMLDGHPNRSGQLDIKHDPGGIVDVEFVVQLLQMRHGSHDPSVRSTETQVALDALPPGSHQIGFYAYGEISHAGRATCELHNQTMTLTTIREAVA